LRVANLGTHPDFKDKMKQLIEERDELIRQAELFRDYQLRCATVLYESEKASAQEEYNVGASSSLGFADD